MDDFCSWQGGGHLPARSLGRGAITNQKLSGDQKVAKRITSEDRFGCVLVAARGGHFAARSLGTLPNGQCQLRANTSKRTTPPPSTHLPQNHKMHGKILGSLLLGNNLHCKIYCFLLVGGGSQFARQHTWFVKASFTSFRTCLTRAKA